MAHPLHDLQALGQSVWLDSIRREYLEPDGYLPRLIAAGELNGLTSNLTIFQKAVADDPSYRRQLAELSGTDARSALWTLMQDDVADACDLFLRQFRDSDGAHGWVSIECDPSKAFDTDATIEEATRLATEIDRPNLFVKVPGTEPGLAAITHLIASGINVNVTLLFSVTRYEAVAHSYLDGLRRRAEADEPLGSAASVASFFVSRVDSKVDALVGGAQDGVHTAGVANARVAYAAFRRIFTGPEFTDLARDGARLQRPLWGSTSSKNPAYPDVLYVEQLAGPDTVNTMPEATLDATRDHADVRDRLTGSEDDARARLERLASEGIDLDQVTKELESEGVDAFVNSFEAAVDEVARVLAEDV